ncbi:uncharacterized protein LOC110038209 isoform X2 [Phalaenopsis equestris]|uniref:uncharacterized protein LOC110038209 isoform X1 n=1 Tax=Phalaenopsis equestris TaxID=78828 RepID=UPI0009E5763A|nr:uncharacterized protein LOC110038209 isoform X1 [Phalaenopsis equestris]XP_020598649.1 uncharacterized protein LOC110038209 isoform X2 [Phalaenopsis equestris]
MSADGAGEAEQTAATKPAKKKRSSFLRCAAAPLRALRRARDMYVRSLGGCAGAGGGGGRGAPMTGVTAGMVAMMPRARSVNAFGNSSNGFGGGGEEDFKELVRANSKQDEARGTGQKEVIRRSQSVAPAIGRIDEEAPCGEEFDGDENSNGSLKPGVLRSRSCAVAPAGRRINGVGVTAA